VPDVLVCEGTLAPSRLPGQEIGVRRIHMSLRHAILVIDLGFGDAGKGTVVDHLVRRTESTAVVRFNGGPQAAHNVVTPDGRHHTFSHFGSGTFVPGVRTILSRFMLVEPYALLTEAAALAGAGVPDALGRLSVDPDCIVITPAHRAANRLRERARGDAAHGTCGIGFGEAVADAASADCLRVRDLRHPERVERALVSITRRKAMQLADVLATAEGPDPDARRRPDWIPHTAAFYEQTARLAAFDDRLPPLRGATGTVVFEGAQGVLLDETHGFQPHTTWSTTTYANADLLLDELGYTGGRQRVGVLRSYATRHGAGPLVTEDATLRPALPEPHNDDRGFQGAFRVGPFDAVAARYALSVVGRVDELALTHMDRLPVLPPHVCNRYEPTVGLSPDAAPDLAHCRPVYEPMQTSDPDGFAQRIAQLLERRVGLLSFGPTAADKRQVER
jgi:adenylosuccinate synthase